MLDIIQNNPYRLLGIYSNSPIRERVVNYNKLKAFLRVRKGTAFGSDLTTLLPAAARTGETVSDANTKMALPNDQLHYAQLDCIVGRGERHYRENSLASKGDLIELFQTCLV